MRRTRKRQKDLFGLFLRLSAVACVWLAIFGGCGAQWTTQPNQDCNPARQPLLQGSPLWKSTFGRSNNPLARACLRLSWGNQPNQGTSTLVEVHANGQIFGKHADKGTYDADVVLTLPPEAKQQPRAFQLFFFGPDLQADDATQITLCQTIKDPGYTCLNQPAGECWFAIAFLPQAPDNSLQATPLPNPDAPVCQFFVRTAGAETTIEANAETPATEASSEPPSETSPKETPATEPSVEPPPEAEPATPEETMTRDAAPSEEPDEAVPVCTPGSKESCYSGPTETLKIGSCRGGIRACLADGTGWGVCVGEITPTPEACDSKDNDCNGLIDEGLHNCPPCTAPCVTTFSGPSDLNPGPAALLWLDHPGAITFDDKGNLYITDTDHHRILTMNPKGWVSVFAGTGSEGFLNGNSLTAQFNAPVGIAFDQITKRLYVADNNNNSIRAIDVTTQNTTTLAGDGQAGYIEGTGSSARFSQPQHIAWDGIGLLYIADSKNHRIRRMGPTGTTSLVAGSGVSGSLDGMLTQAQFALPLGVNTGLQGDIFVADTNNHKIRRYSANGSVTTHAGSGIPGYRDGQAQSALFTTPQHVLADSQGTLYVADTGNHCLRRITAQGQVSTLLGTCGTDGYAEGIGTAARLDTPTGLAWGPQGDLWFVDTGNDLIRKVTLATGQSQKMLGDTLDGLVNGPWHQARWHAPRGIVSDHKGNLFAADTDNHVIRKITPNGDVTTYAGSGTKGYLDGPVANARFDGPKDMVVDKTGNVFVADSSNHMIRKIDTNGLVTTVAGTGTSGFLDGDGNKAMFDTPRGITIDATGNLYLADTDNGCVRKVDLAHQVTTIGGVCKNKGFVDGAQATSRYSDPRFIAWAPGFIYVTDGSNHTVRKIDLATNTTSTLVGNGQSGDADGTGAAGRLKDPKGIAVGPNGNIYVADYGNFSIRKVTPQGVITTIAGSTSGYLDGPASQARMKPPRDVAVDPQGNIYITDTDNHRIRKLFLQ